MTLQLNSKISQELKSLKILNEFEDEIEFGSLWSDKPALIIFVRHFGCIGCTAQMDAIAPRINELVKLGMNIAVIGNGPPSFIEGFRDKFLLDANEVHIFTDPSLKSYELAEMKRSIWTVFSLRTFLDYIKSFSKGIGQSKISGDNWQQGGVILVDENGELKFHFQNKSVAGIADSNDLVEAAQKLYISKMN